MTKKMLLMGTLATIFAFGGGIQSKNKVLDNNYTKVEKTQDVKGSLISVVFTSPYNPNIKISKKAFVLANGDMVIGDYITKNGKKRLKTLSQDSLSKIDKVATLKGKDKNKVAVLSLECPHCKDFVKSKGLDDYNGTIIVVSRYKNIGQVKDKTQLRELFAGKNVETNGTKALTKEKENVTFKDLEVKRVPAFLEIKDNEIYTNFAK